MLALLIFLEILLLYVLPIITKRAKCNYRTILWEKNAYLSIYIYYHVNVWMLLIYMVFISVFFFFLYLVLSSDAETKVGMWMLFHFLLDFHQHSITKQRWCLYKAYWSWLGDCLIIAKSSNGENERGGGCIWILKSV